nr:MAG TPA: hypothetical protein [Caudoviricetes sp.]
MGIFLSLHIFFTLSTLFIEYLLKFREKSKIIIDKLENTLYNLSMI